MDPDIHTIQYFLYSYPSTRSRKYLLYCFPFISISQIQITGIHKHRFFLNLHDKKRRLALKSLLVQTTNLLGHWRESTHTEDWYCCTGLLQSQKERHLKYCRAVHFRGKSEKSCYENSCVNCWWNFPIFSNTTFSFSVGGKMVILGKMTYRKEVQR